MGPEFNEKFIILQKLLEEKILISTKFKEMEKNCSKLEA